MVYPLFKYLHSVVYFFFLFVYECLLNLGGRKINKDSDILDYPVKKGSVRITTR